jgi:hypothetical protein
MYEMNKIKHNNNCGERRQENQMNYENRKYGIKIEGDTITAHFGAFDQNEYRTQANTEVWGYPAKTIAFWKSPKSRGGGWVGVNLETDAVSNHTELYLLLHELRGESQTGDAVDKAGGE